MIVWALFDSGNGCYKEAEKFVEGLEVYSVGIDIENKNDHFINLDLATTELYLGGSTMFDTLSKLPHPDLIIASPPCESWSVGSSIKGGNACWLHKKGEEFELHNFEDINKTRYNPRKQTLNRLNGELCIINTLSIIEHFKPKYYVIENPKSSKIWEYIDKVLGYELPYENNTYYNNYGFEIKKPTRFSSNFDLELKNENIKASITVEDINGYNKRSDIPIDLVVEIFKKIKEEEK